MKLSVVLHKEEDMYVAECLEVGTVSQGKTKKEALANLKEARLKVNFNNISNIAYQRITR